MTPTSRVTESKQYLAVVSPFDIEYRVKESEICTGQPGRRFFICSADRLSYQVESFLGGYNVRRLDSDGLPSPKVFMLASMLHQHPLGNASLTGFLYTQEISGA